MDAYEAKMKQVWEAWERFMDARAAGDYESVAFPPDSAPRGPTAREKAMVKEKEKEEGV